MQAPLRYVDFEDRLNKNDGHHLSEEEFSSEFPEVFVPEGFLYGTHPFTIRRKSIYATFRGKKGPDVQRLACFEAVDGSIHPISR